MLTTHKFELDANSIITFHRIRYSNEPDQKRNFTFVRWDTDESISLNIEGLQILKQLNKGKTIHEVALVCQTSSADIIHLIKFLISVGYVKTIDTLSLPDNFERIRPWLTHSPRKWFRWIIAKPLLIGLVIYVILGILVGFSVEQHIPTYKDFFWTDDLFILTIMGIVVVSILMFLHEFAHLIITKAVGGEARIRLSSRFFNLTALTDHYHLSIVPKPWRYLPYIAGIFFDLIVIASIYWLITVSDIYMWKLGILRQFLWSVLLFEFIGIVAEFNVSIETDIYNLSVDFLDQDNLYNDTKKYLYLKINKISHPLFTPVKGLITMLLFTKKRLSQANDMRLFSKQEQRQLLMFGLIFIFGLILSTWTFFIYFLPRDLIFIFKSVNQLFSASVNQNLEEIIKTLIVIFFSMLPYFLLMNAMRKKYQKHGSFL